MIKYLLLFSAFIMLPPLFCCFEKVLQTTQNLQLSFEKQFSKNPPKWSYLHKAELADSRLTKLCVIMWREDLIMDDDAEKKLTRSNSLFKKTFSFRNKNRNEKFEEKPNDYDDICTMSRRKKSQININISGAYKSFIVDYIKCECSADNNEQKTVLYVIKSAVDGVFYKLIQCDSPNLLRTQLHALFTEVIY